MASISASRALPPLSHAAAALRAPLLLAVSYYIGAEAAFLVGTLSDRIFAPFWPPNVVLFGFLVFAQERRWGVYVAAAVPAHVAAEIGVGMPAPQMIVAFASNVMVALLSAYVVRRLLDGPPWFDNLRKAAIYLLLAVLVSPALSAFAGAFVRILGGGPPNEYWLYWSQWFATNVLGFLTLGPVVLAWLAGGLEDFELANGRRWAEAAGLAIALSVACAGAFWLGAGFVAPGFLPALICLPLPFILWGSIRFGAKGASGTVLIVTVVSISSTLNGASPFLGAAPEDSVLALQLFLIGVAIPALMLGAASEELGQAQRRMRALSAAALGAEEEERRSIAKELHESTGQNLVAATLLTSRIRPALAPAERPLLAELDALLAQSLRELRAAAHDLHPPLLEEAGLSLALQSLAREFSQRSGVAVTLDVSADLERLPAERELALFRLVEEALTNVSRHSGSVTAKVRLAREPSRQGQSIVLTVEDAGRGMPKPAGLFGTLTRRQQGGFGLARMQERLRQLGGAMEIESDVGRTVVRASIPIDGDGAFARRGRR